MARIDGEVGQVDARGPVTADDEDVALDHRAADDLLPAGFERDLADDKAHDGAHQ